MRRSSAHCALRTACRSAILELAPHCASALDNERTSKDSTVPNSQDKAAELRQAALEYHEFPIPGKLAIAATKQMVNQHDLALAYSPGVAAAC